MTKYIYRIDDIHPKMDFDILDEYLTLFEKYGIVPLLGVIPMNEDTSLVYGDEIPEFWTYIKMKQDQGLVEVAQHGYNHVYTTDNGGLLGSKFGFKDQSEFAGLNYDTQLGKIKNGNDILESKGIYTKVFMAPSHSFDENTVEALKNAGFKYVTDGIGLFPYDFSGIRFIPNQFGQPREFPFGIITICLHLKRLDTSTLEKVKTHIKRPNKFIRFTESCTRDENILSRITNYVFKAFYYLVRILLRVLK